MKLGDYFYPSIRRQKSSSVRKEGGSSFVTGLISSIYEKYYKQMEVLYIFPMVFRVKPIFNPI